MRTRVVRCPWWRTDTAARSISPATAESGTCSCSSSRSLAVCSGPTPMVCTGMPVAASLDIAASSRLLPFSAPSLTSTTAAMGTLAAICVTVASASPMRVAPRPPARSPSDSSDFARSSKENSRSSELAPMRFSAPESCSALTPWSRQLGVFPAAVFMLPESSITTATTFSRSRMRSTFSTGRHSSVSSNAKKANCSAARTSRCSIRSSDRRSSVKTMSARPTAASANSSHSGQPRANASSPLRKAQMEWPSRNSIMTGSVAHRVDGVADAEAVSQRRQWLRILRRIRVLPGIAQVHVEVDGDHQSAVIIEHAAPMGFHTVLLVGAARHQRIDAGYLHAVVQVPHHVEDLMVVGDLHHLAVREHAAHGLHETLPLQRAVEVIHHEKAAAQQVVTQPGGLLVIQVPAPHFDGVQEGIVEQLVIQRLHRQHHVADAAFFGIDGVDAGETADALCQVEFGFRGVGGPGSAAESAATEAQGGAVVVGQSRKAEFGLCRLHYQIVGRTARLRARQQRAQGRGGCQAE